MLSVREERRAPHAPVGVPGPTSPDGAVQPVTRMEWQLTSLPESPADPARLAGMRVLLLGGGPSDAAAVERELSARGARVRRHEAAGGASALPGDGAVDAIVDLTLGPASTGASPADGLADAWSGPLLRTVAALREQYEDWASETSAQRLFYLAVTYLGGGMGQHPHDDLAQPLGGVWAGLAKTLHRELPNCNARVVDTGRASAHELPGIIAAELGRPGELEVGYRDGRRLTLTPVAMPVGEPTVTLGPDDCVLISGGGRGIGWELARTLARTYGTRVVVTGREPFPAPDEPWFGVDEAGLKAYEKELWAQRRQGRPLADIRRDIARHRRLWELAANISGARADGLRVDYARCDFTDREQVRALLDREGPGLTGVVHNAGVDIAARLPKKSDDDILRTVHTKIGGFVHLLEELRGHDLKFFCNVGSLTGRLGGMVGQLEYAAANEGLARLGHWAGRQVGFPVMTLAWPTWDRIGLIANFSATLRYMAALDVTDGLAKWQGELLAGTEGEVTFVGPLGGAMSPGQATDYPVVPDLPGFTGTYPRIFHLGEVAEFRPHTRLVSRVTFDPETAPVLRDFLVDGVPTVPVSVLLESAVRGAEWVVPEDYPVLRVACLEEVVVPLELMRLDAGTLWEREVRGAHQGDTWVAEVRFRRPGDGAGGTEPEASLRIVYEPGGIRSPSLPRPDVVRTTTWRSGPPLLEWRSSVVPAAVWSQEPDGRRVAEVPPCAPNDLWATHYVPRTALSFSVLENVVRACARLGESLSVAVDPLVIGRIVVHSQECGNSHVEGDPALGVWKARSVPSGLPVMTISGLRGPIGID
ncbi:KR domain-containing protein [Streptomyces apocyni]|uniref:KR domain-containing protein n=1 Tax=Streptomyces apocyni TaxID=2654677 RepID=UPI0012EA2E53|nr:KR domain-containing protein [Streptomyces apocyni]